MVLSFLGLDYEKVPIALPNQEQKSSEHLVHHSLEKMPALEDGALAVWVLGPSLSISLANTIRRIPGCPPIRSDRRTRRSGSPPLRKKCGMARPLPARFPSSNAPGDHSGAQALACDTFQVLEDHLDGRDWLVSGNPTIADIAVYLYVGLVWEGQLSLDPFPRVVYWMRRIEALPNYVGMDGLSH